MNKAKYPQLAPIYDALCKERDEIEAKLKPLQAQEDALQRAYDEAGTKLRALREQIVAIEGTRRREVCNQLAALERAAGAKVVVAEKGAVAAGKP